MANQDLMDDIKKAKGSLDKGSRTLRVKSNVHAILKKHCELVDCDMSTFTSLAIIEKIEKSINQ